MQWLYSDDTEDRRSGRTYVLALAYVAHALDGRWVDVIDHVNANGTNANLLDTMRRIVAEHGSAYDMLERPYRFRITNVSEKLRSFVYSCLHEAEPLPSAEREPDPPSISAWKRLLEEDAV